MQLFYKNGSLLILISMSVFSHGSAFAAGSNTIESIYTEHCASCHGSDRLGGIGPALLPENLGRVGREQAVKTVFAGLPSTQMPAFRQILDSDQVNALVDFIYTPLADLPDWDIEKINHSHVIYQYAIPLGDTPVFDADPLNLFLVVESGDHHATILDGDRLEPVFRFKTRYALHGGPKYSLDGRYVYLASRDGWISKFDLYNLKLVAEIRAGINTRNIAVSSDGRYVIAGNYLPHTLVILDASDLSLIKVIPVEDAAGKSSRVSAVYDAPPRNSFIVALKDITEIWEIMYADDAVPVYPGLVHDYRYQEGIPDNSPFPVRRIRLDDYLDDFFFDDEYHNLIGAARNAKNGQVVNLIVGKKIADIDLSGLPHLGSGITWQYQGRPIIATPNLKEGIVSIIDVATWKTIKKIETLGPGFFMRTHENTPYAWVDVFFGPDKDAVHVIDKSTLEIVKTLRPAPGATSGHVEFSRNGQYALLSIWENNGAIVVFDSNTLQEVKRIAMNKPSGKYNVYNKINGSSGTSH
jgi:DNA-binding beta-propeller fold protein YncE